MTMLAAADEGSLIAILVIVYLVIPAAVLVGCGFGARSIMRNKGRSPRAGFCLGFFLGLPGLVIAAVLQPTPQHEAERLRQQMIMMGLQPGSVGPDGVPMAGVPQFVPTATQAQGTSALVPSLVIGGCAVIALVLLVQGRWYLPLFSTNLMPLFFVAAAVACAVLALVRSTEPVFPLLAVGMGLALQGSGLPSVLYSDNWSIWTLMLTVSDGLFIAAAIVLVVGVSGRKPTEAWFAPTLFSLAGLATVLVFALGNEYGLKSGIVLALPVAIGSVISAWAALRSVQAAIVGAAWGATILGFSIVTAFNWLPRYSSPSVLSMLALFAALGVGGIAARIALPELQAAQRRRFAGSIDSVSADGSVAPFVPSAPLPPQSPPPQSPPPVTPWAPAPPSPVPAAPTPAPLASTPQPVQSAAISDRTMTKDELAALRAGRRIRLDDGSVLDLIGVLVIGRDPRPPAHLPQARPVALVDPTSSISRTHLAIGIERGAIWVSDLGSVNGTELVSATGRRVVGSGERVEISADTVVEFGERSLRLD